MNRFFILVILVTTAVATASAATWWVKGDVSSSGDGKTPFTPFKSIQEGIDAAAEGDTVIVAEGTYYENIEFKGPNIVLMSGDPDDTSVRDATIIDGNDAGSVVEFSGSEDETCVLTGFTIRNGAATARPPGVSGQGTYATIEYNLITGNRGGNGGGLSDCRGTVRHNWIMGNSAQYGGGLYLCDGTIQNNTISDNSAGQGGGLYDCDGAIENNTIAENRAWFFGGGLAHCSAAVRSNLIVGNSARLGDTGCGGGFSSCAGRVENNTIVQNDAGLSGGGLYECASIILNCVIWENTASSDPQLSGESYLRYCCIQYWTGGGEGNTSLYPIFLDADGPDNDPNTFEDNDYRLWETSPCIDKGKNEDWMKQATDLDGNLRIFHGLTSATVDMGAYEYDSFRFAVSRFDRTPTGEPRIRWTSRPGERYVVWSKPVLYTTGPIHVIWEEEDSVMAFAGSTVWTDQAASGRTKFYRVEVEP